MDKKLLEALTGLSQALEYLSETLDKSDKDKGPKSNVGKSIIGANINKQIESINNGVKSIQKDTKEILKNQQTIIELSRKQREPETAYGNIKTTQQKQKVKDGVSMILMISAGVLALGLAFKLTSGIDFKSVLALAISMPLLAIAFEKMSKFKVDKDVIKTSLLLSTSVALSSIILSLVKPISLRQAITAILIGTTLTALSFGLGKLSMGISKIEKADKFYNQAPLVLVSLSTAIALSSYILGRVSPISLSQAVTSILIASTFVAISFGLEKISKSVSDLKDPDKFVTTAPKVLLAIAASIVLSSFIFKLTQPIPISTLLNITILSVALSVISVVLGGSLYLLTKFGDIDKGIFSMVKIAAAVMASSLLFSLGSYDIYPTFDWILSTGATFIAYGLISFLMGLVSEQVTDGIVPLIGVAAAIMASSLLISFGNYENYPTLDWAIGVGLSLGVFGLGAVLLGTQAFDPMFYLGLPLMALVAGTILAVSYIFNAGSYKNYPNLNWATGVGLSLGAFGLGAVLLGIQAINPLFYIGLGTILSMSLLINEVSNIFSKGNYNTKYPNKNWIEGVGNSLSSFANIIGKIGISGIALNAIGSFLGEGPLDIAKNIVQVDSILGIGKFTNYPTESWVQSVTSGLYGFGSLGNKEGFLSGIKNFLSTSPIDLSKQMVEVSNILNEGKFSTIPDLSKMLQVSDILSKLSASGGEDLTNTLSNIKVYISLLSNLDSQDIGLSNITSMSDGISKMASSYDKLSDSVKKLSSSFQTLDVNKLTALKTLSSSVVLMSLMDSDQFESMMDALEKKSNIFKDILDEVNEGTVSRDIKIKPASIPNQQKPLDDILTVMQQMNSKLGFIVSNSDNMSRYVNEIRTNKVNIKKNK